MVRARRHHFGSAYRPQFSPIFFGAMQAYGRAIDLINVGEEARLVQKFVESES